MSSTVNNLPKRMNAVVNHGRGDFRYEELKVPQPGPEEVLVRVQTTGICGSDIKCLQTGSGRARLADDPKARNVR
jgi:threonine dehydrogenase-like Zn-dependent dehydrogenase